MWSNISNLTFIVFFLNTEYAAVYLNPKAFENPSDYYGLQMMDQQSAEDIEKYLQGGGLNNLKLKVMVKMVFALTIIYELPLWAQYD